MINYKQLYARKKLCENRLKSACSRIDNASGIYFLTREEDTRKYAYIGKATHLIERMTSHLMGYQQRIDISLKKRGFANEYFDGWHLNIIHCNKELLDSEEQRYIREYQKAGYELYNKESGGTIGKTMINERKPAKTYRDGLQQGYKNCIKEIEPTLKYLDIKVKKDNKISQKMLKKFQNIFENMRKMFDK